MDIERAYFSDLGEWTNQEREFAERAVNDIGIEAWHNLLAIQRKEGNDAFVKATMQIWPGGMPPEIDHAVERDEYRS
jgi:hypothetical protein